MKPKIRVFRGYELDKEWTRVAQSICDKIVKKYKLSFPPIDFHFANLDEMAAIVATGGWIVYPQHWSVGQTYYLRKFLQKFYRESVLEIVVGSGEIKEKKIEPIQAFINQTISDTAKKMVIAHVLGHAHVFYNNRVLRKFYLEEPIPSLYLLCQKINKYELLYGEERVQNFITDLFHLSTLIELYPERKIRVEKGKGIRGEMEREKERERLEKVLKKDAWRKKFPGKDEYDILKFLHKHAPLEEWEKDLLKEFRRVFYFELSLGRCKVLHEGFATLIETLYFLESTSEEVKDWELVEWSKSYGWGLYEPNIGEHLKEGFNPYFLGYRLFIHALTKFGTGREGIGYEYESKWYKRVKEGFNWFKDVDWKKAWSRILQIVETYDDFMFINEFFDVEFFNRWGRRYFVYEGEGYPWYKKIVSSRDYGEVKKSFLFHTYNLKKPRVFIPAGTYKKRVEEELYLKQDTSAPEKIGIPKHQLTLNEEKLKAVLKAFYRIWKKPANLETFKVEFEKIEKDRVAWWWWYYWLWPWQPCMPEFEVKKAKVKAIKEVIVRYDGKKFEIKTKG